MRKKIIVFSTLFLALCSAIVFALGTFSESLTLPVTALAANTTNSTAGTIYELYQGQKKVRIFLTASGVAATTNGSLVVKFSTASGGGAGVTNNFDTASASNIKLTMSSLGGATNTVSDWFVTDGVKYIRVGQMENTFVGAVSNIAVVVGWQDDS